MVSSVIYRLARGAVWQASLYVVTAGAAIMYPGGRWRPNLPVLSTDPATPRSSCHGFPQGQSHREVINGHQVIVSRLPAPFGGPPFQQLCAAHADELKVVITVLGSHPAVDVVSLFAHHLQLLGPDPANWASNPIG